MTGKGACTVPPPGWSCSRGHGHEGPCAARPTCDAKPKHVSCDDYTEYKETFGLYKEQREAIKTWMEFHDKDKHIRPGGSHRYSGAIGGAYSYTFTGTSLGVVTVVQCSCGESIDVSDYDHW